MSIAGWRLSTAVIVFCLLMTLVAQTTSRGLHAQEQPERKVIKTVAPKYPEEFKNQQLGGVVHLSVVIAPDGSVKGVTPISGNRALVDAAIEAVKQWEYEPSNETTTGNVQFDFRPE